MTLDRVRVDMVDANSPSRTPLAFAGLTVVAIVLSFVIYRTTGEWPSDLGHWGPIVLAVVAVALVGVYMFARTRTELTP